MNVISNVVALFFSCFVFFMLFSRRIYFLSVWVYLISILKAKNSCYSRDLPFLILSAIVLVVWKWTRKYVNAFFAF